MQNKFNYKLIVSFLFMRKRILSTILACCGLGIASVQATSVNELSTEATKQHALFITNPESAHPYRIPAIATAVNGDIFAISDFRPCNMDIGYGEVDVKCRISKDNGQTWGEEFFVANGVGDNHGGEVWKTGFGDAAIVADAERNELLVMLVCGKTVCWHGNYIPNSPKSNPNRVARVRAKFNEVNGQWEWSAPVEVTEQIYRQFVDKNNQPTVQSLFIGSGRICQSRLIKVGDYYRLYCAVWTKNGGNRVLYSDDFGENWYRLGTIDERPAPNGDEPKCEELPDGSVVLSSRCNGRYFNIFSYTNIQKAEGSWGAVAYSGEQNKGVNAIGNSTNGEIMILPVTNNTTKQKTFLTLQSVPFGPKGRQNVGFSYKELTDFATDFASPAKLAVDWDGHFQVSNMGSAYSTMTLQKDNTIGFLYEEATYERDYTIVYRNLSLEEITNGAYSYCTDKKWNKKYVAKNIASQKVELYFPEGKQNFKVGEVNPTEKGALTKLAKKARKSGQPQDIATLNAALQGATIQAENEGHYYLRNMGFEEKKSAYTNNLYLTATEDGLTAQALSQNSGAQVWTLLRMSNNEWLIYNAQLKCYIGNVGKSSTIVPLCNDAAQAGRFKIISDLEGKTTFVAVKPENATYPCLHLSQQMTVVAWNASQPSIWEAIIANPAK